MGTKRLLALFLLSVGLGLGGLYLATREAVLAPATYQLLTPRPGLVALALVALVALWTAPVAKLRLLAAAQGLRLRAGEAFLGHVAQVFGTAMSPSGTGGGPAMMLAFERLGVPVGTGLGIAIQLFVLDLAALGVLIPSGIVYLLAYSQLELPPLTTALAGLLAALALAGAIALARYPRLIYSLVLRLARWRPLRRFSERLTRVAREYYVSAVAFRDMPLRIWTQLHSANLVAWLASFALFWALLNLYGTEARLLDVLSVLSIVTLIGFFVPTPGAAGVTELMLGLAVGASATATSIAAPVALWRAGTFYVVYLLGPLCAWVLLSRSRGDWREGRWLRPRRKDRAK